MNFLLRVALVFGAIFLGVNLVNYFVLDQTADYLPGGDRMGEWKQAGIREACFPALEHPESDGQLPKMSNREHRVDWKDINRTVEMTAALNCYLVTYPNAICERNNRAYIVDYINRYFAKFDQMMETARRYGDAELANVRDLWDSPRNRAISSALARNAGNGRLIKADFGWSTPKAMQSMLDQYKATADNCVRT
jgi:hypothetical protein